MVADVEGRIPGELGVVSMAAATICARRAVSVKVRVAARRGGAFMIG